MKEREQQNEDDDDQKSDHAHAIAREAALLQRKFTFVGREMGRRVSHKGILREGAAGF